jgi:hypothetical protein
MILDSSGKPLKMEPPSLPTAAETFASKKLDTQYDKVFVRHLVKNFSKLSPDLGAVFYPHTQTIAFWYNGFIIYKLLLDQFNLDATSMEEHLKRCWAALTYVKEHPEFQERCRIAMKMVNKKSGKLL